MKMRMSFLDWIDIFLGLSKNIDVHSVRSARFGSSGANDNQKFLTG